MFGRRWGSGRTLVPPRKRQRFLLNDLKRAFGGRNTTWLSAAKLAGVGYRVRYFAGDGSPVYWGWTRSEAKLIMEIVFAKRGREHLRRAGVR